MARSFRYTLAIAGALSWACHGAVLAAEPVETGVRLVIPAGSLDRALQALATQSRVQILYAPGLVERREAPGLQAQLPPEQALAILLRDTGLRAERVNANTFVITQAPTPAPAPVVPAASSAPVELATVQVTGTHIPRTSLDIVTPVPRTVITRAQIDASGYQTVFELLSYQPGMVSHHPVDVATEGGFRSQQPFAAAATTSLYGLGPRATLFLIDGRRVANYGLASADLGGLTDLNGIPLSMVERVEIIRGGASAIYGADAMAGVVNIILRKGQDGGEVIANYGLSERGDAEQYRVSFRYGQSTDAGGNLFLGVDYFHRDALEGSERPWRSSNLSRLGLGDWRIPLGYRSLEDFSLIQPACPPDVQDASGACFLDKPRYITLQPEMESQAVYGHLRQPVSEDVEFYADLRLGQVRQRLQGAPLHGTVILPFGHPDDFNPGVATILDYAFFDVGPVRSRSQAQTADVGLGFKGDLGSWQWQADLLHHRNTVDTWIDGLVSNSALNQVVFDESYRFNATDNPQAVLSALSPRVEANGEAKLDQLVLAFNGPLFQMPAGAAQAAVGLELSRDALRNQPDALMIEHDVALGAQKIVIDDHSYSSALYAELSMPLTQTLHADLAVRVDHRQGYGSENSPMLGLKWNLMPSLTLRGSAATGYRAPSLFELRRPSTTGDLDFIVQTPEIGPCALSSSTEDGSLTYCLVELSSIENPDLQPETSRSYTVGMVWAPIESFDLSLDHFQIRRRNEIVATSALNNPAAFPKALERNENGELVAINDYFENIGRTDVRGWELQSEYRLDTTQLGRFNFRLAASYLERLERQLSADSPTLDYAGYNGPQRAVLAGVEWLYGHWNTTLNLHEYGPVNVGQPGQPCPPENLEVRRCRTPAFATADLYLAYTGWAGWKLSLNINNLTDHTPVNYDVNKGGYDIAYDDPRGRYYLLSAAYRF